MGQQGEGDRKDEKLKITFRTIENVVMLEGTRIKMGAGGVTATGDGVGLVCFVAFYQFSLFIIFSILRMFFLQFPAEHENIYMQKMYY